MKISVIYLALSPFFDYVVFRWKSLDFDPQQAPQQLLASGNIYQTYPSMSMSHTSLPGPSSQLATIALALPEYDRWLPYTITRTQGNLQITPAFAWKEEEGRFIAARLLEGKVPQSPLRLRFARSSIAAGFLKCIEQYRPHSISRRGQPTPHWPDEAALVVVAVIQIFGFDALRLNAADERILRLNNNGRKSTYSSYLATFRVRLKRRYSY